VLITGEAAAEPVEAFGGWLPQLSSIAEPLDLAARDVGMSPTLSGLRNRIEDVAVGSVARGHGIAGRLTEEALRLARAAGARTVDLTSRPAPTSAPAPTAPPAPTSPLDPTCRGQPAL
jgi:GNAT superfamily N-acetyltransferase